MVEAGRRTGRRVTTRKRVAAILGLCLSSTIGTGCAGSFSATEFGLYEQFQPVINRQGPMVVELAREAHVMVLTVLTPAHEGRGLPLLFQVEYPRFETEQSLIEAGRHPLRTQVSRVAYATCEEGELPRIGVCLPALYLQAGLTSRDDIYLFYSGFQRLVIASEDFMDPFVIAHNLYEYARFENALSESLLPDSEVDKQAVWAEALRSAIRTSQPWAAYFVTW